MLRARLASPLALALLVAGRAALAEPGAGTPDDPIVVDAFPYVVADTTAGAPSDAIDSYSCSSSTDESGPERIYEFELAAPAKVMAWVEGDGGGVDIDVHLLDDATLSGAEASSCVGRGNVITEVEMAAGVHYAVVDTFNGDAQAGDYVLHLEAIGDAWVERTVADGVLWRARRFVDLGGPQVVHELIVDTSVSDVEVRAIAASGCQTVPAIGNAVGAVAGINGGYFNMISTCPPVSLLIESGSLVGTNGTTRGAFGLTSDQVPMVELVAAGQDWPSAYEAHGGGPILVVAGTANQGSSAWAAEGFTSSSFNGVNPRTFAGIDADGATHFATVDGRRSSAAGLSLDDLATLAQGELALVDAVNLDGGGSTTMWVAGRTPNGVVNYPSGGGEESADHGGLRANSGGFFVFAPPYNHPPRFQTEPVLSVAAGEDYDYDADAIDLDVDDTISFSLTEGPEGMTVEPTTGVVTYAATVESPPSADVTVRASDDRGASTDQSYSLQIDGGMGAGGQGGGAAGEGGGDAGSGGAVSAIPSGDDDGGCACRAAAGRERGPLASLPWLAITAAMAWRRRRRREGRRA
ncbi:MAG: phosphodiester glycosidase family protein [Deltaproteobacteria bacterium]|jgi:hypothetical protein|nr:phosphodiester glycosidase family protein [Deltaproteobacteria bacterium]MBW2533501.1 phosphodiester glycosidase family protein [Deltaproteobacteria bacterium]